MKINKHIIYIMYTPILLLISCSTVIDGGTYYSKSDDIVTITTRSPAAFTMQDNHARCVMFWKKLDDSNPSVFYGSNCNEGESEYTRNSTDEWRAEFVDDDRTTVRFSYLGKIVYVVKKQT